MKIIEVAGECLTHDPNSVISLVQCFDSDL